MICGSYKFHIFLLVHTKQQKRHFRDEITFRGSLDKLDEKKRRQDPLKIIQWFDCQPKDSSTIKTLIICSIKWRLNSHPTIIMLYSKKDNNLIQDHLWYKDVLEIMLKTINIWNNYMLPWTFKHGKKMLSNKLIIYN